MKYVVLKVEDINKHCTDDSKNGLKACLYDVQQGRISEGKTESNNYLVVNTDEPYANEIKEVIESHEGQKVTFN